MMSFDPMVSNNVNRIPKSPIFKGLEFEQGIFVLVGLILVIFGSVILYSFGVGKIFYFAPFMAGFLWLIKNTLVYFNRNKKEGFLMSFISYYFQQKKVIYVRKSVIDFSRKK